MYYRISSFASFKPGEKVCSDYVNDRLVDLTFVSKRVFPDKVRFTLRIGKCGSIVKRDVRLFQCFGGPFHGERVFSFDAYGLGEDRFGFFYEQYNCASSQPNAFSRKRIGALPSSVMIWVRREKW